MKVVIAIDSFKGSLSSNELGDALSLGIKKIYKDAEIIKIPIADGGEGTVEAMVEGTEGKFIEVEVHDPLMNKIKAIYGILGDGKTAIIEMAIASGLPLVPAEKRNPNKTTTFGTGELIKDAIKKGCREFIIGIGGSATNDGGLGMMQALGYKFYDKEGKELGQGGEIMNQIEKIDSTQALEELSQCKFLVACDVDNPFYGPRGAAHVYGKQKGANEQMILELDNGLKHLSEILNKTYNIDISNLPGAGAAGGLGGGLVAFLNGILKPGIEIILEKVEFEKKVINSDFVITGEGRIDFQTVMGKAPVGVSKLAKKYNIPVIALAGSVADDADKTHEAGIDSIFSIINYPISLEDAMKKENSKKFVEKNAEEIFRLIKICENKFSK
ncbi:glycerate kinase [Cetobacterium ceti]|uniref:Glycerate kinase n=1 Tax=Cetobacterium ceti TaxID=180163 RepID=A0A1T4P639_9FUSO|nr:glycerate kinase [Cetobacterium ceti]SJZ86861.1 glycerate kinase [Cetobacterium ceti]